MADLDPLNVAKDYVDANFPGMKGGVFTSRTHDPQKDLHLVQHLDDVEDVHLDEDPYHVVSVQKDIELHGGVVIPSILKLKVKDGAVTSILGSKSFNAGQV